MNSLQVYFNLRYYCSCLRWVFLLFLYQSIFHEILHPDTLCKNWGNHGCKEVKSVITYLNVMISSFPPELPLVRRQMRGVGWVQGKSRDPFLAGTRLKFPNIYDLEHQSWFKKLKKGAGCNSMLYYLKNRPLALSWKWKAIFEPWFKLLGFNCGSMDGVVVRVLPSHPSHHCELGSNLGPSITCGLSLWLVLVLAPRGFL